MKRLFLLLWQLGLSKIGIIVEFFHRIRYGGAYGEILSTMDWIVFEYKSIIVLDLLSGKSCGGIAAKLAARGISCLDGWLEW
ncbi:hypothetical protein RUMHYD_00558 [Blautia hydrogenotrophica DSM 10507]|uniref:Uncharacterized protein n=1 Tax=Blautia hydrogenotrophica (strain DSM 10507 / JCM 14656 / S5a33) TaxID=476272 RepID=C0CI94_BLAHS|nr:hypothetical protein RUMHYD_00558 [Blautia hydrogenotrophica DSM 10507]